MVTAKSIRVNIPNKTSVWTKTPIMLVPASGFHFDRQTDVTLKIVSAEDNSEDESEDEPLIHFVKTDVKLSHAKTKDTDATTVKCKDTDVTAEKRKATDATSRKPKDSNATTGKVKNTDPTSEKEDDTDITEERKDVTIGKEKDIDEVVQGVVDFESSNDEDKETKLVKPTSRMKLTSVRKRKRTEEARESILKRILQNNKKPMSMETEDFIEIDETKTPSSKIKKPKDSRKSWKHTIAPEFEEKSREIFKTEKTCHLCGEKFNKLSLLDSHLVQTHEHQMIYQCTFCEKTYKSYHGFRNHIRYHMVVKTYVCEYCGFRSKSERSLKNHLFLKHEIGEMRYVCDSCGKGFQFKSELESHMNRHSGDRPYQCHLCGADYAWERSLAQHMVVSHPESLERPLLKCSQCSFKTTSRERVEAHESTAHNKKCTECGKTFKSTSSLTRHKQIHTGNRRFECNLCEKRFYVRHNLSLHMRTHFKQSNRVYRQKNIYVLAGHQAVSESPEFQSVDSHDCDSD